VDNVSLEGLSAGGTSASRSTRVHAVSITVVLSDDGGMYGCDCLKWGAARRCGRVITLEKERG
jgi:hypothetical protein